MLVVVSDLHLADGSTSRNVSDAAFRLLGNEIAAEFVDKKATELHLVLLGDIFDFVRTDWWHANGIPAGGRPWGGELDPQTGMNSNSVEIERQFTAIFERILVQPEVQSFLRMIQQLPGGASKYVTYVIGNHDRVFHNFPTLKTRLTRDILNLSFASVFRAPQYGFLGRHGHEWDENCHGWEFLNKVLGKKIRGFTPVKRFSSESYQVMAIGEVVTAELMSGLVARMKAFTPAPSGADEEFLLQLREANNLRPMMDVFHWLDWFAKDQLSSQRDHLHQALKESLQAVLECSLAKEWDHVKTDTLVSGDLTDRLQLVKKFLLGDSFEEFRRNVEAAGAIKRIFGAFETTEDKYFRGAEQEGDWHTPLPGQIQYVVYGHTHRAKHVTLSGLADNLVKMYINTGTYLPLIEKTIDGKGFSTAHQMTMSFFYRTEEDAERRVGQGPTVSLWSGIRRKTYSTNPLPA